MSIYIIFKKLEVNQYSKEPLQWSKLNYAKVQPAGRYIELAPVSRSRQ